MKCLSQKSPVVWSSLYICLVCFNCCSHYKEKLSYCQELLSLLLILFCVEPEESTQSSGSEFIVCPVGCCYFSVSFDVRKIFLRKDSQLYIISTALSCIYSIDRSIADLG